MGRGEGKLGVRPGDGPGEGPGEKLGGAWGESAAAPGQPCGNVAMILEKDLGRAWEEPWGKFFFLAEGVASNKKNSRVVVKITRQAWRGPEGEPG